MVAEPGGGLRTGTGDDATLAIGSWAAMAAQPRGVAAAEDSAANDDGVEQTEKKAKREEDEGEKAANVQVSTNRLNF